MSVVTAAVESQSWAIRNVLANEVLRNRDVRAQRTSDASGSTVGLVLQMQKQLVLCTLNKMREGY